MKCVNGFIFLGMEGLLKRKYENPLPVCTQKKATESKASQPSAQQDGQVFILFVQTGVDVGGGSSTDIENVDTVFIMRPTKFCRKQM